MYLIFDTQITSELAYAQIILKILVIRARGREIIQQTARFISKYTRAAIFFVRITTDEKLHCLLPEQQCLSFR